MTTAIAPEQPELITSGWNDLGVCIDPEVLKVDGLGKKHAVEIRLGVAPDGSWRMGYGWTNNEHSGVEEVKLSSSFVYADRIEAIRGALLAVTHYFSANKKSSAALDAFYEMVMSAPAPVTERIEPPSVDLAMPLPHGRFDELPVGAITPNPENHRKHFDSVAMKELADSIVQTGLLQPIAVRLLTPEELGELPVGGEGAEPLRYEIILGERRWRAHVALGRATIEAKVYEGVSRKQAKAAALIENLQRKEVNAIEEAEGYRDLMAAEELTAEQCAKRVGRSRPVVANSLRVLDLPAGVVELIREERLTIAHGLALHRYRDRPEIVKVMAEQAVEEKTSAGQLETWNRDNYVPFYRALEAAGLIAVIGRHDLPGGYGSEWPEAWAEDPDYLQRDEWSCFCWAPAKAREYLDAAKAEIAEAKAKEQAKREQTKKKTGIKSLEDLDDYEPINPAQAELTELLPEAKVLTLKRDEDEDSETVTVCTAPKFAEAVSSALAAAKRADREAKLPVLLTEARAKVRKWRKLGTAETAIVLIVSLMSDREDDAAYISPAAAKSQGVTIPAALKLDDYEGYHSRTPADVGKAIKALAADPVAYARVMVDDFITALFCNSYDWDRTGEPDEWKFKTVGENPMDLLSAILDKPLGLLEDTAAGRRKLVAQVRALPWYAAAFEQASKAGEDMGEIGVTTDPKVLAEWVRAEADGMPIAEIARSYGVSVEDVSGALAGRAGAEEGDNE